MANGEAGLTLLYKTSPKRSCDTFCRAARYILYMPTQRGIASIAIFILAAIGLLTAGAAYYRVKTPLGNDAANISSFEECVAAGYPIMESYPRQCGVPNGPRFTEIITDDAACAAVSCMVGTTCINGVCIENEKLSIETNACAATLCPSNTRCENGTCVPLETTITSNNDPCMYTRCMAGYRCEAGTGKCQKDACYMMDCFEAGTSCIDGACKKISTYDDCVKAKGEMMYSMTGAAPRCQIFGTIYVFEETETKATPNHCAPPCTGMPPSREVTEACWDLATESACNAFTSTEFPYRCQWGPADAICPPYP